MELKLDYYFNNYEDNEVFKKLTEGITNIWEMHETGKKFLDTEVVAKDKTENNGTCIDENKVTFIGNYAIGEGTVIYPGVVIEGPVYIGKNVKIMPGAYVRPGTIVGDKCVIGFNSEVKNSIIQNGAKIASLSFVGDSILGKSARIGSGVITANRRFDQQNIKLKQENGEKLDAGVDFFGCILGDYSRLGASSVTSPRNIHWTIYMDLPFNSSSWFYPSAEKSI